jgi:hypothetical protein
MGEGVAIKGSLGKSLILAVKETPFQQRFWLRWSKHTALPCSLTTTKTPNRVLDANGSRHAGRGSQTQEYK